MHKHVYKDHADEHDLLDYLDNVKRSKTREIDALNAWRTRPIPAVSFLPPANVQKFPDDANLADMAKTIELNVFGRIVITAPTPSPVPSTSPPN